jgi:hypothetical protein
MTLRAFQWDHPLPEGFVEDLKAFDAGGPEKFYPVPYRLTVAEMDDEEGEWT